MTTSSAPGKVYLFGEHAVVYGEPAVPCAIERRARVTVEELLFRGAAIGAVVAGFGTPAWAIALVSSLAFGAAHGAQGRVGMALATALGLALAGAFVATGSLVVVIVAHYLVNAMEFVVHEGLGIEGLD